MEWNSKGVMDDDSGDDNIDGLTSEWGDESNQDKTGEADEMNGSWLQRRGDEQSVIFNEEKVGGRERVTTDEKRVLRGGWREIMLWR